MPGEESHQTGEKLFAQGQYEAALRAFRQAIGEEETADRWNDWASAEFAGGRVVRAEWGYRRALRFEPASRLAALNLAGLLIAQGRFEEAAPILAPHAPSLSEAEKGRLRTLVTTGSGGRIQGTALPRPNSELLLDAFMSVTALIPNDDPTMPRDLREANRRRHFDSRYYVRECSALFQSLPQEARWLALGKLQERSRFDPRSLLVLACHYLALDDPRTALGFAREAMELRPYDLHVQRLLIEAELASLPEEARAEHPRAGLEEYLADSFCGEPWTHLLVQADGDVYFCCSGWLVAPAGNAYQTPPAEIWNSPAAQSIRQSILDGSFRYCARVHCVRMETRTLEKRRAVTEDGVRSFPCIYLAPGAQPDTPAQPSSAEPAAAFPIVCPEGPRDLMLGHDRTCNLACPQCRRDFHSVDKEEQERLDKLVQDLLSSGLLKNAQSLRLNESGEVFASKNCRRLLKELKKESYPNLNLAILTNGQLCDRKAFDDLGLWGRLSLVNISIDAATEETYRLVRRGGDFKRLLANLEFLDSIRKHEGEKFSMLFTFVVSLWNFREIPAFVELGKRFHALVGLSSLRNHLSLSPEEFKQIDIVNPDHPEHAELLAVLADERLRDPCVGFGSIEHLRPNPARCPDAGLRTGGSDAGRCLPAHSDRPRSASAA